MNGFLNQETKFCGDAPFSELYDMVKTLGEEEFYKQYNGPKGVSLRDIPVKCIKSNKKKRKK